MTSHGRLAARRWSRSIAARWRRRSLAPHAVDEHFPGLLNAPPTRAAHRSTTAGAWHAPFIYPWRLVNQLEQRYEQDRSAPVPLAWLAAAAWSRRRDEARAPLLLLGADSYGRDVFSRLLFGARMSLGLASLAALGAMLDRRGDRRHWPATRAALLDDLLMRATDFVMVLPAMYVALALRAVLPLVSPPRRCSCCSPSIFAVVGAPFVARGVRAIVRTERRLEYAVAAASLGAGHARLLVRHLLPAARGFVGVQMTLLGAGVHRGGSDAVVRRPRVSRSGRELGHDAARRVERPRAGRFSMAAAARRRRCSWSCSD